MQSTTTDDQVQGTRKIVKAKRRTDKNAGAMIDPETGEEIEFEDDSDDMDDQCIDEQDVIHPENDDWEDEEEQMVAEADKKDAEKKKKKKKKSKAEKTGEEEKKEGPAMST